MNVEIAPSLMSSQKDPAPQDQRSVIAAAVHQILVALGENPEREGLRDTPLRVAKMYEEIFSGMAEDPRDHLRTQFSEDQHEGIVVIKDITFHSVCEHHLIPFYGKAHVAYVPQAGRLTGLSKIARVVETVARRPQIQERLTTQVVSAIWDVLKPKGVLVIVEAMHMCMVMRGIRSPDSSTITVVSRGTLETDSVLRAETVKLLRA